MKNLISTLLLNLGFRKQSFAMDVVVRGAKQTDSARASAFPTLTCV